jgi:hypothetical protein
VTGTLIAPLIPSSVAARPARAPAAARTLSLTVPPVRPPALPRDVVYGLAHVDRSGRVADRTVTGALGWRGGDRLTLTAEAGVIVIRRDPSGLVTLPPRSCVPIPAALRYRCGLHPGDPVLLTAVPAEDTLTAQERPGLPRRTSSPCAGSFNHRTRVTARPPTLRSS